jgi:four helix bundle protein
MEKGTPFKQKNVIGDKSFDFALKILFLYRELKTIREYDIGRQILRSGTSIGANVSEALAAQSKKDFISKMAIASKESRETFYWLHLIKKGNLTSFNLDPLLKDCDEILRILTAIVKTSQKNQTKN